jgi:LAO/AO transport system kinase
MNDLVIDDVAEVIRRAKALEKVAIASLVSCCEDTRPEAAPVRSRLMAELREQTAERRSVVIGVTGTPGSGKSSLLARVVPELLKRDDSLSVAVVAIDPSSHVSKGALLGDRTRMHFPPGEQRSYLRSQATASVLGGLGPSTYQVCMLLGRLFDATLVETVGIGQSELDIRELADHVCLVLQPLGGDEVQFLKAGIIEIPDTFILNKCDEPSARKSYHQLVSTLSLARPFDGERPPVLRASATSGEGVDEVADVFSEVIRRGPLQGAGGLEVQAFNRWVREEWGRRGHEYLVDQLGGAERWIGVCRGYEGAQTGFTAMVGSAFGSARVGR